VAAECRRYVYLAQLMYCHISTMFSLQGEIDFDDYNVMVEIRVGTYISSFLNLRKVSLIHRMYGILPCCAASDM
jgi:hypothetical protein